MSLMRFKEWEAINESSLFDKIKNWFSGNFGGSIEKVDKLLGEYRKAELRFVDEWEDIRKEIDKLELQRSQVKNDPAEIKKIDRLITRNHQVITSSSKVHEKQTDEIFSRVRDAIKSNDRIESYWETNKIKVDAEIAEEMYRRAKRLTDQDLAEDLYRDYKAAVLRSKEKDQAFKEEFGNLIGSFIPESPKEYEKDNVSKSEGGPTEATFELLSKMSLIDFDHEAKSLSREDAKRLVSYLTKERNDKYVALDMERDALNSQIEKSAGDHETREFAAKKIKEIREKYMGEIRDLRSKITVAKRYV